MKRILLSLAVLSSMLLGMLPQPTLAYYQINLLVKGRGPAVFWVSADGQRYSFPNAGTYYSWFPDFRNIQTMSDEDLAQIPMAGQMTYRPGAKLLKTPSDPKIYAVSRYGVLRWITDETVASGLYGSRWQLQIQEIPSSLFSTYSIGTPIAH